MNLLRAAGFEAVVLIDADYDVRAVRDENRRVVRRALGKSFRLALNRRRAVTHHCASARIAPPIGGLRRAPTRGKPVDFAGMRV